VILQFEIKKEHNSAVTVHWKTSYQTCRYSTYRLTLPSKQRVCHLLQFLQPQNTSVPRILVTRPVAGGARGCCTAASNVSRPTCRSPNRSHLLPLLNRRSFSKLYVCAVLQSAHCVVLPKAVSTVAHISHLYTCMYRATLCSCAGHRPACDKV
jgi:hypothetical protein